MKKALHILLLSSNPSYTEFVKNELNTVWVDSEILVIETKKGYVEALGSFQPDLMISDVQLSDFNGLSALHIKEEAAPKVPLIMFTESDSIETAVECMKAGADDYVLLSNIKRLKPAVLRAIEKKEPEPVVNQKDNEELAFLTETAMDFVEFPIEKDIFAYIGDKIQELVGPDSFIFVNSVDEETCVSTIRAVLGMGKFTKKIIRFFGRNPVGMTFDVEDPNLHYQDGKLHLYEEGFYGLLLKTIPESICKSLERLVNFDKAYAVDLARKERFFGSIIILLQKGAAELGNKTIIETFIKQASIAIQKRQTEEALAESNQNFEQVVSNLSADIWRADIGPNGTFINTYISSVTDDLLGLPKGTINHDWDKFFSYIKPEYLEQVGAAFEEAIQIPGKAINCEYEVIKANKQSAWLHSVGKCIETNGNLRVYGSTMDVTERKNAEEKIRFQANLLDTVEQSVIVTLLDGEIIYWNHFAEQLYGWSAEEVIGCNIVDITVPELSQEQATQIMAKLRSGESWSGEFTVQHQTGKTFPASVTDTPIYDDKEELFAIIGTSIDITERRQAEDALKESEEKYRILVETASDAIYLISEDGVIIDTNRMACTMLEKAKDEIIGSKIDSIDPNYPLDEFLKFWESIPFYAQTIFETTHQRKNGSLIPVEVSGNKYKLNGKVLYYGIARDITERKQAEANLKLTTERLQLSTESAKIGIWDFDLINRHLIWDQQMCELYGIQPEEFDGVYEAWKKGVHPEDIERSNAEVQDAISGKKEFHTQFRIVWPDGQIRYIAAHASVTRDLDGTPIKMTGANWDITEIKLAEAELKSQKDLFELVINTVPSSIFWKDLNSVYLGSNTHFAKQAGFKNPEEIIGKLDESMVWEINAEKYRADDQFVMSTGQSKIGYEEEFFDTEGNKITWETSKVPLRNNDGQIIGVLATARDITIKKMVQIALQESEEKFRNLYENSPFGITICKMLKNETSEYTDFIHLEANQSTEKNTGFELNQIVGKKASEMVDSAILGELVTLYGSVIKSGEPVTFERHYEIYDRILEVTVFPHYDDYFIISFIDISDRKKAEQALINLNDELEQRVRDRTVELRQANADLMKALQTKDEFLANMSHELRTPLTAILGISEILELGIRGPLNEAQVKSVKTIYQSGEHLLSLINDILDLSKIDAGKLEIEPDRILAADICEASFSIVKGMALVKDIDLSLYISDPEAQIWADARRLKQILVNLLSNAIKFSSQGGKVSLNVDLDKQNNEIKFIVKDNGIGISEDDMGKLFEPFTQLDASLSRKYEGTGLGLALARRLVHLHQGEVFVKSEGVPGKGSVFTVVLPMAPNLSSGYSIERKTDDETILTALELPAEENQPVILLAEDNLETMITISEYLQSCGYKIIQAKNGLEAIEKANSILPDLILMDIQMPQMDGLEAIRRLRQDKKFTHTPILALTALAMPGDQERCLKAGASDYIRKPVKMKVLNDKIKNFL